MTNQPKGRRVPAESAAPTTGKPLACVITGASHLTLRRVGSTTGYIISGNPTEEQQRYTRNQHRKAK